MGNGGVLTLKYTTVCKNCILIVFKIWAQGGGVLTPISPRPLATPLKYHDIQYLECHNYEHILQYTLCKQLN